MGLYILQFSLFFSGILYRLPGVFKEGNFFSI